MTNYINADKLKAEIERLQKFSNSMSNNAINSNMRNFYDGEKDCCKKLLLFIDSLQQKPQEEICSKCIHHHRKDDECYYPHGGMQWRVNENGVYECTGFCEKEQEQSKADLDADIEIEWESFDKNVAKYGEESEDVVWLNWNSFVDIATHFYKFGLKARKEE